MRHIGEMVHYNRTEIYQETQQQCADRCGLSKSQISELENGVCTDPRLSTVMKLCDGLKMSPNMVFRYLKEPVCE